MQKFEYYSSAVLGAFSPFFFLPQRINKRIGEKFCAVEERE
jgi:hypothetical protein